MSRSFSVVLLLASGVVGGYEYVPQEETKEEAKKSLGECYTLEV